MGKAKINAENIEMARKKYYHYCDDKVIKKSDYLRRRVAGGYTTSTRSHTNLVFMKRKDDIIPLFQ